MLKFLIYIMLILFLALPTLLINTGCTAIGYGIGKSIDNSNADQVVVDADTLKQSGYYFDKQNVIVVLKDESIIKGKVKDIENPDHLVLTVRQVKGESIYSKPYPEYIAWDDISKIIIPHPDDTGRMVGMTIGGFFDSTIILLVILGIIASFILRYFIIL